MFVDLCFSLCFQLGIMMIWGEGGVLELSVEFLTEETGLRLSREAVHDEVAR